MKISVLLWNIWLDSNAYVYEIITKSKARLLYNFKSVKERKLKKTLIQPLQSFAI